MSGDRVSPTAHYTGYVWARNGLSHRELETIEGRVFYETVRPAMTVSGLLGRDTLEAYLLTRHRALDLLLERGIEDGTVGQVLEIACGMSPRGWRFSQRHGEAITYVEADLPAMATRKRAALQRMGSLSEHHRVVEIDALRDDGPQSLAAIASELDPERGLAIITEGLLVYLDGASMGRMWRRFARVLGGFAHGLYLADITFGEGLSADTRAFYKVLGVFVRGTVHVHFDNAEQAAAALRTAGFASAQAPAAVALLGEPDRPGARRVHIIEASTVPS